MPHLWGCCVLWQPWAIPSMGRTSDCSKMSRRTVQYWIAECRYSLIRYEGRGKGRIVQNFILVSQNWAFLLHPAVRCAILIIEKGKTTAHKGLTSYEMVIELPPCYWSKFWGGFSMLKTLLDKRKYECQQCQDEHSKSHKVFKIKMFHQHHPHSM